MATIQQLDRNKPKGRCRDWRLWVNRNGKRHSRRFHGTYTEARAAADAFDAELREIEEREPTPTFAEYADKWAEWRILSNEYAVGTLTNDERAIRAFARTGIYNMRLAEITPEDAREALLWLRNNPAKKAGTLSGTTANKLYRAMHSIFEQAVRDGRIAKSPLEGQRAPKIDTQERPLLPPDKITSVLDALDGMPLNGRTMTIRLILMLGLRRAEACALMVDDIEGDLCHVRHAVKERDGRIGAPKSAAGIRTLPMPERCVKSVSEWLSERDRLGLGDAPTLCCNEFGRVMRPQLLQRWWNKVRADLGCDGLTLHELRHSNLSMMARHMPSAFDLQRWAGWSSLEPARVYIHSDMDALTAGVNSAFGASGAPKMHQKESR